MADQSLPSMTGQNFKLSNRDSLKPQQALLQQKDTASLIEKGEQQRRASHQPSSEIQSRITP